MKEESLNSQQDASQTSTPNPSQDQTAIQSSINNSSKRLLEIVGLVIFVLVVALIAYLFGRLSTKPQTSNTSLLEPTPTTTTSQIPTSTLKITPMVTPTNSGTLSVDQSTGQTTYTNTPNEYSLSIPAGWKINDEQGVFIANSGEAVLALLDADAKDPFSLKIAITTSTTQSPRFPYSNEQEFQSKFAEPVSSGTGQDTYKIRNLTVGGENAMQFVHSPTSQASGGFYAVITWVRHGGKNYYFELAPDKQHADQYLDTYNILLSSIIFQ